MVLAHRSSYLRSAQVRGRSTELITCEDTVCFSPSLLAPARVRVPLETIVEMRKLSVIVHCTLWSVLCLVYTSVCTVSAQATADEPLFNRTEELEGLKRPLLSPPSRSCIYPLVMTDARSRYYVTAALGPRRDSVRTLLQPADECIV